MPRSLLVAVSLIVISSAGTFAKTERIQATLANAPKEHSFIAGDVAWRCDGADCMSASEASESDASLCRELSRTAGPVATFQNFDAAKLDKCNGVKR